MTLKQRRVLEILASKKRTSPYIAQTELAEKARYDASGFIRTRETLCKKGLIFVKKETVKGVTTTYIRITPKGIDWLRYNPDISKNFEPDSPMGGKVDYTNAVRLWEALALDTIQMKTSSYTKFKRDKETKSLEITDIPSSKERCYCHQEALKIIHKHRCFTSMRFCPANVSEQDDPDTKGTQALWTAIELEKSLPVEDQQRFVLRHIREFGEAKPVAAVYDGEAITYYFLTQNVIKRKNTFVTAMRKLSEHIGGYIRRYESIPGTINHNIKPHEKARLIFWEPQNRINLKHLKEL